MVRDWTEAEADAALWEKRSRLLVVPHNLGHVEVFVEVISPPLPLLVFGGGPDAVPVVRLAKELGWHVTGADTRPANAGSPFPGSRPSHPDSAGASTRGLKRRA
jgi:xanthine/CO dehydrogenase XdhC/CoxF family maturation factor